MNIETIDRSEVIKNLHEGICKITFTKVNGDKRVMHCTLQENLLPVKESPVNELANRASNPNALAVWDVEAQGWRSFRWDSIIEVSTEYNL